MAARSAWWDQRSSNQTVTSTSAWTTVASKTVLCAAATDYWVMAFVSYGADTISIIHSLSLLHQTTGTELHLLHDNLLKTAEVSDRCLLLGKCTSPGAGNHTFIVRAKISATATITIKEITLVVIAAATGDQFASDDTTDTTTSATLQDHLALAWTAGTNEDHLIIASAEIESSATSNTGADLYDGTTSYGNSDTSFRTGVNTGNGWGEVVKATLSGAQSWKLRFASKNGSGTARMRYGRILALKNQASEDMFYTASRTKSTRTSSTYASKAAVSQTAKQAPYLVLGRACIDMANTTNYVGAKIILGGSDLDAPALWSPSAGAGSGSDMAFAYGTVDNVGAAGARTWDLHYASTDNTGTAGIYEASLAAMEVAAGAVPRANTLKRGRMMGGVGRMMRR